jgi:hypothetical protein
MTKKKFKLARVEWLDANGTTHWCHLKEAQQRPLSKITTTGYILRNDKEVLTLAGSFTDNGNVHDTTAIPRGWVKKITMIKGQTFEYQE